MQNINFPIFSFSRKLLAPMSTRVPLEVQEIVDDLADGNRAKWLREAIEEKIEMETGQSLSVHVKKSKNTASTSVFQKVFSFFHALKKPDVAGRASGIHQLTGK